MISEYIIFLVISMLIVYNIICVVCDAEKTVQSVIIIVYQRNNLISFYFWCKYYFYYNNLNRGRRAVQNSGSKLAINGIFVLLVNEVNVDVWFFMNNEAHLYLNGFVNNQNCHIWSYASENSKKKWHLYTCYKIFIKLLYIKNILSYVCLFFAIFPRPTLYILLLGNNKFKRQQHDVTINIILCIHWCWISVPNSNVFWIKIPLENKTQDMSIYLYS